MADLSRELESLQRELAALSSSAKSQQAVISQLQKKQQDSLQELEALLGNQLAQMISAALPDILPQVLGQIHPGLSQLVSVLDGQDGLDFDLFRQLISGEGQDISAHQLEQIMQNVRLLLQDTIQQQISHSLRNSFF